jgi:hypothetical protein
MLLDIGGNATLQALRDDGQFQYDPDTYEITLTNKTTIKKIFAIRRFDKNPQKIHSMGRCLAMVLNGKES